ncbi:mediator of RNA polymerase II transcription subunit 15a-like isoform X1 [Phoenix dactylifera]|uniref:Mediator of RNA polymerase II transcription subunit 15a-like isoform X1 n=1 Tax=Phoenix dactylifera TaxID=42345 RepID=A0A8B9A8K3_PHODC|nr:mediator of RNA polymerase II transcription subunit 15a-like isoform X1 [Phoenix dactylifera]
MEGSTRNPSRVEGSARADARPADWRSDLNAESRQRVVGKIISSLKKHFPPGASEGLSDFQKLAVRFEQKVYAAATSQDDYLRRISAKLLTMETRAQNGAGINSSPSVLATESQNLADPGIGTKESSPTASLGIQSQVSYEGQSLAMSHVNQSPVLPPLLPQNHQHKATLATTQGSASLSHTMSSVSGFSRSTVANADQTSHFQSISSVSQNFVSSSAGQGLTPERYANGQRQNWGRQQQPQAFISQQHQQQSQNTFVYQHELQQQILKQNVSHPSLLQAQIQQQHLQQQQQNFLHLNQVKSSQQPSMQMTSSLQSGQSMVHQMRPTVAQSASQPNLQKNQIQQCVPSSLKQHPQLVARQKKQAQPIIHQQSSSLQQECTYVPQQFILSSSQKLMGQHSSISDMQHSKLLGQQNSALNMKQQQKRLPGQKTSLISMQQAQPESSQRIISLHQQQQLRSQSNISGLKPQLQPHQQQQRQLIFGSHSSASNMQPNECTVPSSQQTKAVTQQRIQQPTVTFLQSQGRLSQYQSSQQQLMPQVQSQPPRLHQQLALHQQPNLLQQEMQQRPQSSGALLQPQNLIEEQRPYIHSQRGLPEATSNTLVDSTAQIGNADVVDRQEEIYQEIMSWKKYSTELNEFNGRITLKIAQFHHEGVNAAATKQSKQFEKAKSCQSASRLILNLLHTSKSNINSDVMRKFPLLQNFMSNFINSRKNRSVPSQPQGHSQSMPQHLPSQVSQLQQHDNHVNEVQRINLPCSVASMQSAAAPSMQLGSMPLSTAVNVPTTQQNMANTLQPTPSLDPTKQGSLDSMKQGTVGLVQQDDVGSLQTTISASQQLHQVTQLPLHQMPQHQKNDVNELKGRQSSGIKSGLYQRHYPSGQHHNYSHQQLKAGVSFPISSPQNLQPTSLQVSQHSSPQKIDQNILLSSLPKEQTPSQSANSTFISSPYAPTTPSPVPGDPEKHFSISSLSNAVIIGHQQAFSSPQSHPITISTPGISASQLLEEFSSPDGCEANVVFTTLGKSNAKEQPINRLIKAVQSLSPKKLSSSVNDIRSVISMIDGIAGSAPGNGSRAALGEDLVASTKFHLEAQELMSQDGNNMTKKLKRDITARPLNVMPSAGSMSDSFQQSELESTSTSNFKRQKVEVWYNPICFLV